MTFNTHSVILYIYSSSIYIYICFRIYIFGDNGQLKVRYEITPNFFAIHKRLFFKTQIRNRVTTYEYISLFD